MKNYTIYFLLLTLTTFALGFSGLEFPGASVVRFICLLAGIGTLVSCLDAVLLSKRKRTYKKTMKVEKVNSK